jgi:2-oxoglutarate ferredoxin oxidoreductase subunit alpha
MDSDRTIGGPNEPSGGVARHVQQGEKVSQQSPDTAVLDDEGGGGSPRIINDFSIQVATINGSGSQSANLVLMRSIFQMGIPVSGKNLFPSNIAGLPTWFTIRANKDGWTARRKELDFLIAMNPGTAREDVMDLDPGRVVVYEKRLKLSELRNDLIFYPVPFAQLAGDIISDSRLRKLLANMLYVGVVGELMHIDRTEIDVAIAKQFKGKKKAIELNQRAIEIGAGWAAKNLVKRDPFECERMDRTSGKIIIDGNAACALGAMFAGATVATWYPITPSSALCESLTGYMKQYRHDQDGKATYAIVQAEDELAAVGMAIGAGWAGARSMTSTSGPGISLMGEFVGLAYYAEIPLVIYDVVRVGPSTGLPTRTQQSDILSLALLSHGDTRHVVVIPGSVEECFSLSMDAFNLAERLQTPVFVMTDLDLGMNNWMADPFTFPKTPIDRGKVMSREDLERVGKFERYRDVDGDAIPYRTLPGTDHPLASYFTRGSGHNEKAGYSERPEDYVNNVDRLNRKYETARRLVPAPIVEHVEGAKVGFLAFGTTDVAIGECRDQLEREYGIKTHYLRLRALPFTSEVEQFVDHCDRVYVVEQNRDAQMLSLLKIDLPPEKIVKLGSILHYSGIPLDARFVTDALVSAENARNDARKDVRNDARKKEND